MHSSKVKVGGRYVLKIFGSPRLVDVVAFQCYKGKEKPRKIWSVVEVDTGKCYSVFSARSFLEQVSSDTNEPDSAGSGQESENPSSQESAAQQDEQVSVAQEDAGAAEKKEEDQTNDTGGAFFSSDPVFFN